MLISTLKEKINTNHIDEAICIVEKIGEKRLNEAVPYLIEQLQLTKSHVLRNSIALALCDIGNSDAVEPIVHVLKDPKTLGYRGTLLASLEAFDYSPHIDMLFEFLIEGNFEVSRKSFLLIESIIENIPERTKQQYLERLQDEIERLEEKHDLLSEARNMF